MHLNATYRGMQKFLLTVPKLAATQWLSSQKHTRMEGSLTGKHKVGKTVENKWRQWTKEMNEHENSEREDLKKVTKKENM